MGDPQQRGAAPHQGHGQPLQSGGGIGVERRRGLVEQQHLRLGQQGPGQAGALALPAGQRPLLPVEEQLGKPHPLQGLDGGGGRHLRTGHPEVVEHGPAEGDGPLEHHPHPATVAERVEGGHVLVPEPQHPGGRRLEAVAEAEERRLPRPGRPHQHRAPTLGELEVDTGQDLDAPEAHRHALEREQGGHPRHARTVPHLPHPVALLFDGSRESTPTTHPGRPFRSVAHACTLP